MNAGELIDLLKTVPRDKRVVAVYDGQEQEFEVDFISVDGTKIVIDSENMVC